MYQVGKYEVEACINDQEVNEKNKPGGQGLQRYPRKEEDFLPEDERVAQAIEQRISSSLKASYIWIKNNKRKDILNYYYSVENGTWLFDKSRIFQS